MVLRGVSAPRSGDAVKFDKWVVLDKIGWRPHPGQLLVAESTARHRVVSAGRRFGKSDIGGHELVPEALFAYTQRGRLEEQMKRREFWIVGPNYVDAEKEFRVLYNELTRLRVPFDKPGTYYDPTGGNMHISLWNGAFQVHAKSAQHEESLVGEGLTGVILAEAAKLKDKIWVKYVRPTLADFGGWSLHTSTPEGRNAFYERWKMGQDPYQTDWASWRMPSWVNPYVYKTPTSTKHVQYLQNVMQRIDQGEPPWLKEALYKDVDSMTLAAFCEKHELEIDTEILDLMGDLTPEAFNQEIGAEFTEFVGRVFKEFDEERHVGDLQFDSGWETVAAVDYGFTNPNVWMLIQIGPWGEINVLDELYESGLTAEEFADEIIRRGLAPSGLRTFYPDPASPGDTRVLEQRLRVRASAGTGGELRYRLDGIRKALKSQQVDVANSATRMRPQMMFDRKCTQAIYEFNEYRYPEKKEQSSIPSQELPLKKDDHTPEALGRFFKGYFGTPQQTAGGSKSRKARVRR